MTHEEIIIELNIDLYTMRKKYKTLETTSERYRKWWMEEQEKLDALMFKVEVFKIDLKIAHDLIEDLKSDTKEVLK